MPTLFMDEVETPSSIVSLLTRHRDQGIFIIEPIGIRKWSEYAERCEKTLVPLYRTLGYNISGFYYCNPVLSKEFLFLLKNNGMLQILNEDMDVLDTIETGVIPTPGAEYIFKYDDISNQLFVNLTEDTIFAIELRIFQESFHFTHKKRPSAHIIHQFSSTIVDFDISFHFNEYMSEEFQTIATLLRDNSYNSIFVKIIYRVNPRKSYIDEKWSILLPNISLGINVAGYTFRSCLIETIANIGFVVITSHGFLFLSLPHGPQNFINDFIIPDILDQKDVFQQLKFDCNSSDESKLCPVALRKNTRDKVITFEVVTGDNKHAVITFTKVREEEEKYIIYWKQDLKLSKLSDNESADFRKICYCTFINSANLDYINITDEGDIYVKSFDRKIKAVHLTLQETRSTYASLSSNLINDYVGIGTTSLQDAVFTSAAHSFVDYFNYVEITSEGIKEVHITDPFNHSNLTQVHIRNTKSNSSCEITRDMLIKWSDTDRTCQLDIYDKLATFVLDSSVVSTGSNVTVIGINNEIVIIENYQPQFRRIRLQENVKIDSIFLQEFEENGITYRNIWISDLNSLLWVIDFETGKVKDTIKLHHKVLKFCDSLSLSSSYTGPIIYTRDCLILSRVCEHNSKLELLSLSSIPFKFQAIKPNYQSNCIEAFGENCYELTIKHEHNYNKKLKSITLQEQVSVINYVRSSPCSPYLICIVIDPVENITYLKLFSMNEESFIQTIDLSTLYPKAIVTDITFVPYAEPKNSTLDSEKKYKEELHHAEKLILDECFILSLNYEISESEDHDNILLYSIDEELGQIIFQNSIRTGSSITCLSNFINNYFIASGESTEMFKINYSVKWNSFLIKLISNKLETKGLVKSIVTLEEGNDRYKLLLMDLFRGLRDIDISLNKSMSQKNKELAYELQYVTSSEEHPIINDVNQAKFISHFESVEINRNRWFVLGLDSNRLKFYYYDGSEGEYETAELSLPNELLNISSVNDKRFEYWQDEDEDGIFASQNILFVINTKNGGTYNIRLADKEVRLSRQKRNILFQHLHFIAGDGEASEDDSEVEDDEEEDSIKIIDSKIISEYSLNL